MPVDERSSPVVDLQSAGCPTVTPSYCWRPFICYSCVSQHLEWSSWRCRVCHIFTNISAKTENTNIYFDNLTRTLGYFVTVSIIHHSGPCCFYLGHYIRLRNGLFCVDWDVNHNSINHSINLVYNVHSLPRLPVGFWDHRTNSIKP